jgi:beta-phosphoglucomutase-like phosphatase (HAD superfamily)
MKISDSYNTVVFDCDDVVLNSNTVKTDAFRAVTLPFGEPASDAFVELHKQNGGVLRFKKFDHFLETILPDYARDFSLKRS